MMSNIWINDSLADSEFHQFTININKENIRTKPAPEEEDVMPTIKREKPSNKQFSKISRLSFWQ